MTSYSLIILPVLFGGLTYILFLKKYPNIFDYPIDFGLIFRGKRVFGHNKTFRGTIYMPIFTLLFGNILNLTLYAGIDTWGYLLVGIFYILFELPNSLIKRQLGIKPGKYGKYRSLQKLVDLSDSMIGCGFAYYLFFDFPTHTIVISVIIGIGLHFCTDLLMKKISLKN
ncbi:CDP-archaeol synthase [bacterium]|nr:CDP-archaeol synthase [bacterium]